MSGTGTCSIAGVRLITNSDFFLVISGSSVSRVNLDNCHLVCSNNTGISLTSSNVAANVTMNFCRGNITTTGISLFASSSPGSITINYCYFFNDGGTTTASTLSSGTLIIFWCDISFPITSSGTAFTSFFYSQIIAAGNTTALTVGGSGSQIAEYCLFSSGTGTAISVGSALDISTCIIKSSNAAAIAGAGTIHYSMLDFIGGSSAITTTTQTQNGTIRGISNGASPAAGFLGEVMESKIGSGASVSLNVSGNWFNLVSVTLTPGVWDLDGLVAIAGGAVTGTLTGAAIATNNTGAGTVGDTTATLPTTPNAVSAVCLVVPRVRKAISASTQYFLNAACTYTVGAPVAWGRLTAVRVG
jgi:hypothetical protein